MKHRITVVFDFDVSNDPAMAADLASTVTAVKTAILQTWFNRQPDRAIVRAEVIPGDAPAPTVAPTVLP